MKALAFVSQLAIPTFVFFIIVYGAWKKVRVYDCFVTGARDGVRVIINIFPYLLAIFIAVKAFQASGAFDFIKAGMAALLDLCNVPPEVIPIALIKPLSGSAATAIFTDIVKTTGPDSLASRMSGVIMGSAETTFYILAVYLGAVGIRNTKYLIPVCIIADAFGIVIAIILVKIFF